MRFWRTLGYHLHTLPRSVMILHIECAHPGEPISLPSADNRTVKFGLEVIS